jgi:hypothetical protein
VSKSADNDNRKKRAPGAQNDNRATAPRKRGLHPWAEAVDSIDFGPAVAAVADLAGWALDLAAADVVDWPEGVRRVRTCRRFVLRRLRGQHTRGIPFEDVLFTAGLLARIFESEIGLGMSEMVAVLDKIGLPTEVVPMMPRAQPHAHVAARRMAAPPEVLELFRAAARQMEASGELDDDVIAPCDACGHRPRYRNAA